MSIRILVSFLLLSATAHTSALAAACVNKFIHQRANNRVTMTLLTGHLTFDDAKELAAAISSGDKGPIEWQSMDGRVIARQFGELKVVRPMPIACGEKASGVVVQAIFPSPTQPAERLRVRFDEALVVDFVAQKD